MRVPQRIVDRIVSRFARPLHVHKPDTGLDQPPRQQHALAPAIPAIPVANLGRLLLNRECVAGLAARQQTECLRLQLVECRLAKSLLGLGEMPVDLCEQTHSLLQTQRADSPQLQLIDTVFSLRRVTEEQIRIPPPAHQATSLPGRRHVLVEPIDIRDPDRRESWQFGTRRQAFDDRAEVRPIRGLYRPRLGPTYL